MKQILSLLDRSKTVYVFTGTFFIAGIVLAFIFKGTCDEGDSIMHYQYAKYAPQHPELFFNHWAKPVFVLLASLPSQFGIKGIKIFNLLMLVLSAVLSFKIAGLLKIPHKSLAAVFTLMMPAAMVYSLSGLTEPMFAFILTLTIWLYLQDKIVWSVLILSFLPFVRSEGLMMFGGFGLLLLLERRYWLIPLLGVGHLVYSIAGYFYFHNFLWVFTEIPYARLSSAYGQGTWDHFFIKSLWIVGVPLYFLLGAGILFLFIHFFRRNFFKENRREILLIYACFLSFFLGHVVFWALGIFNSFGLLRVLVGVLPIMAVIQLRGLNLFVCQIQNPIIQSTAVLLLVAYVITFPFTPNPYAWNVRRDFAVSTDQEIQNEMAYDIRKNYPDYQQRTFYFNANYVSVALNFDYFDKRISKRVQELSSDSAQPTNSFLVWDHWYAGIEGNVSLESIIQDSSFVKLKDYVRYKGYNPYKTVLFKTKDFPTKRFY